MPSTTLFHATPAIPSRLDLSPVEVASRLRHLPGLVFFDSAKADGASLSVVAAAPVETIHGKVATDWPRLQAAIAKRKANDVSDDGLPHGFAAGWISYDGEFCFGIYEEALVYRHAQQRWFEVGDLASRLGPEREAHCSPPEFRPQCRREEFCAAVARAQEYIAAGDIYQVNLSHRFASAWSGEPWALYEALLKIWIGEADLCLVYAFGKSSPGELRTVLTLQLDPYYHVPLWPDAISLAALQARALLDSGEITERDMAEVVARSRGNPTR